MTSQRLKDKRVVITGAASGIGLATATRFATEGAHIALIDVDAAALERQAAILREGSTSDVLTYDADVSDETRLAAAIESAERSWRGLDVVIANAAINLLGRDDRADRLTLDVWRQILDVNLTGTFLTCKHGIRALLNSGGGSVICTGSPTGLFGGSPGSDAYSASKGGVHALVRVMAADYARDNIRVNSVIPGFTDTPMVKSLVENDDVRETIVGMSLIRRPGRADEVASMMCFLASDEAGYATGALFIVDGGATAI
jgi:NAD(P)-dependent dehydrogenase (short-subunit alcohol dehydrogenase family)